MGLSPATGYSNMTVLKQVPNPNPTPSIKGLFSGHEAKVQVYWLFIPFQTNKQKITVFVGFFTEILAETIG